MVVFLWDEFRPMVTISSIRRGLLTKGWSIKQYGGVLKDKNADLRNYYLHCLSGFKSYYLVYVDESGCDKCAGFRRTGWPPRQDQTYQILSVYSQDGIALSRVFCGSTDATVFEGFIAQLLQYCGRWPEPKSVLVMDNVLSQDFLVYMVVSGKYHFFNQFSICGF